MDSFVHAAHRHSDTYIYSIGDCCWELVCYSDAAKNEKRDSIATTSNWYLIRKQCELIDAKRVHRQMPRSPYFGFLKIYVLNFSIWQNKSNETNADEWCVYVHVCDVCELERDAGSPGIGVAYPSLNEVCTHTRCRHSILAHIAAGTTPYLLYAVYTPACIQYTLSASDKIKCISFGLRCFQWKQATSVAVCSLLFHFVFFYLFFF